MGDRTSVSLMILKEDKEKFESNAKAIDADDYDSNAPWHEDEKFVYYQYYEVNYGNLPFIDDLIRLGIPHDTEWDSGSEYGPGSSYARFTKDGEVQHLEVSNEHRNPSLTGLIERLDDHEALKQFILDHKEQTVPLPLDEQQLINAKVYLTKQLISAT